MLSAAENLEDGIATYGATEIQKINAKRPVKARVSPTLIVGCVVVPWLIFTITYYMLSFFIRYWMPYVAYAVVAIMLLACLFFGYMAYAAMLGKGGDPLWLGVLFLLSLVGWTWAVCAGSVNYTNFMQPYFDLQQLNVYQSVNPAQAEGNQYMDFGALTFVEEAHIDREYAMAFKNDETYCVAPVKINGTSPTTYDFWAVGINCCTSHLYDFRCGQYNNPAAHSGLRVVEASSRSFYQLAAKQAAAAFNIPVRHPVFFEWTMDPKDVIDGYQEDGFKSLLTGAFYFFGVEVIAVVLVACAFSKV